MATVAFINRSWGIAHSHGGRADDHWPWERHRKGDFHTEHDAAHPTWTKPDGKTPYKPTAAEVKRYAAALLAPEEETVKAYYAPKPIAAVTEAGSSSDDAKAKILSRIGTKVAFQYPGDEGAKHGILKDRAVSNSSNAPGVVPYWDVVDLIEFKDEEEPEWIRIGYYRKPRKTLNWGSQTTITEPISVWKTLLVNAARDKKWFRDLLKDVMNELLE